MISIYLFTLILGFTVIIIDLLGLIDNDSESEGDFDSGGEDVYSSGDDNSVDLDADDDAVVLPDTKKGRWIYTLLNLLRSIVYFCLGFGAVGIFGSLTQRASINTLLWSAGTGIAVLILVKSIMKLQKNVVDSQVKTGELLFSEAEVLVTIPPGKLGRIRVQIGGSYHDLFARARDTHATYPPGTEVFIVDMSEADPVVDTTKS